MPEAFKMPKYPDEGPLYVWLDDNRPAPAGWVHVLTPWHAIDLLKTGRVNTISLDNDLGLLSYVTPNEGRHVIDWMEEATISGELVNHVRTDIHTMNPVAYDYMMGVRYRIGQIWKARREAEIEAAAWEDSNDE